jgi:hypothetical protein
MSESLQITLTQAVAMTGMAKATLLRAIHRGMLSGTRNSDGSWLIDPAELAALPLDTAHPFRRNAYHAEVLS